MPGRSSSEKQGQSSFSKAVTTYAYNGLGQLWSQTSPETGTTTFTCNAKGQMPRMTRATPALAAYYLLLNHPGKNGVGYFGNCAVRTNWS